DAWWLLRDRLSTPLCKHECLTDDVASNLTSYKHVEVRTGFRDVMMLSVSQMEEAISRFGLNPKGGAINEWRRQTQFENEEVNPDKVELRVTQATLLCDLLKLAVQKFARNTVLHMQDDSKFFLPLSEGGEKDGNRLDLTERVEMSEYFVMSDED
ncbi:unnamed protein product, partial [Symbiodinium sp. KB8]